MIFKFDNFSHVTSIYFYCKSTFVLSEDSRHFEIIIHFVWVKYELNLNHHNSIS